MVLVSSVFDKFSARGQFVGVEKYMCDEQEVCNNVSLIRIFFQELNTTIVDLGESYM